MALLLFSNRMRLVNQDGSLTREGLEAFQSLVDRTGGSTGAIAATSITVSPTGGVSSTNAQAAIAELDAEKEATGTAAAAVVAHVALADPHTQYATDVALTAHTGDTANPHAVTKAQVGLSNVDNTSDANKPVSTATQTALDLKLRIANPVSTGNHYFEQAAPTSKAGAATLLIAEVLAGIIEYTGAAANLTLPDGSDIDSGVVTSLAVDRAFEFSVINTGSGTVTIAPGASVTLVGTMTVTVGASGLFRVRKTAINTFTVYRVA